MAPLIEFTLALRDRIGSIKFLRAASLALRFLRGVQLRLPVPDVAQRELRIGVRDEAAESMDGASSDGNLAPFGRIERRADVARAKRPSAGHRLYDRIATAGPPAQASQDRVAHV